MATRVPGLSLSSAPEMQKSNKSNTVVKTFLSLFLSVFLVNSSAVYAQYNINENKNWVFGNNAGLDFNGGAPVAFISNVTGHGGSASVSNASGTMLFYSDGETVYDKTGAVMPNGSTVVAYSTLNSFQPALIVPVIGNPNRYYLFSLEQSGGSGRLSYSIVDMTLNGGLGDVVFASKGISLGSGFSNKITAIQGNSCNIWVIVHSNTSAQFTTLNITATGIGAPVNTTIGTLSDYDNGAIKPSPNRTKFAVSCFTGLELYDFNATTGVISNCQVLYTSFTMGVEFSPDNSKLYMKQSSGTQGIYQYDLSAGSTPAIIASKVFLAPNSNTTDLRLAPDNKIYLADPAPATNTMACIQLPNVAGTGCNYANTIVTLSPATGIGGAFGNVFIKDPSMPDAGVIVGASSVCVGSLILLSDATSGGTWSASNTNVSVSSLGLVSGVAAGTSVVSYTVTGPCGSASATKIITVSAATNAGVIVGPSSVCVGTSISLTDAAPGGVWSSSNGNITVSSGGVVSGVIVGTSTVSYTVTGGCGTAVAKGTITVVNVPDPLTGGTGVCVGNRLDLTDAVGGGTWSSDNIAAATVDGMGGVSGITAGTATIYYTIGSICSVSSVITVDPPLPAITGMNSVCVGNTITLSDATPGGNWSSLATTVTVNTTTGDVQGTASGVAIISYAVSSGCMATKSITINPLPQPIMLTSGAMCYSDRTMFATDADAGGTWTSALVTVGTGGFITAYATGSGLLTYTLPTGCAITTPITVNPVPALITGPKKICTGMLYTLGNAVSGGTWSSTDPYILIDLNSGDIYGNSAGTAIVTYALPTNCYVVDTIRVFETPTAILGDLNVCIGNTTKLSDAVIGGTWSMAAGGNASIDIATGAMTGILAGTTTVSYTTGSGCSITAPVTVWPLPAAYTVTGGGGYCSGGLGVHVGLSGSVIGTRYYLYNSFSVVDSMTGIGTSLDFGLRTFAGLYTVSAKNLTTGCEQMMIGDARITVDPILVPIVNITTLPDADTICAGTSMTFTAGSLYGGSMPKYQWKVNGSDVGTGLSSYTYVPNNGDLVGVQLTSNATCAAPLIAFSFVTITVETPVVPALVVTVDPGVSIPEGGTATFTAVITNTVPAPTYQWIKNGTPIPGELRSTYTTNTLADKDIIGCKVWSGGLCTMSATESLHMNVFNEGGNENHVGIQTTTNADAVLSVVPNPSRGAFTVIGVTGSTADEAITLELTNILGQVVYTGNTIAKDGKINKQVILKNALANGTYLLNVRSGAIHKVFHIVIEQ